MPRKAELKWGTRRLRGRLWWVGYYANGEQQWESTHSTDEKDADALLDLRYREIKAGTYQRALPAQVKVGEILDMVVDDYRANQKNAAWAEALINKHLRPDFSTMPLSKFNQRSASLIRSYMLKRQQEGAANASVNRERSLLHRAFSVALEFKEIDRIPPFPPAFKEDNIRRGFFDDEMYQRMRATLPPSKRPILDFGYYSLCRKAEIETLEWPQVDLIGRTARLEPGTTKGDRLSGGDGPQGRTIPLRKHLYEILLMQRQIRDQSFPDCRWVFFNYETGEPERIGYDAWLRACRRLGWVRLKDTPPERNKSYQRTKDPIHLYRPTVLFHDLRRTGIRNVTRAGVPERVVMTWSGHRTRAVFDRYNIINDADLTWAAERADALEEQRRQAEGALEVANDSRRVPPLPAISRLNDDKTMTVAQVEASKLLN